MGDRLFCYLGNTKASGFWYIFFHLTHNILKCRKAWYAWIILSTSICNSEFQGAKKNPENEISQLVLIK